MTSRATLTLLAVFVAATSFATAARAGPEDEARARVKRGLALYDEGDHRLALVELERAYEIAPSYKLLYNIAQIHIQLGEYARAQRALLKYLHDGGAAIAPERRAEVETDLATLATRVATLTVEVNVEGADVFVNDQAAGRAPLSRLSVEPGSLRIVVAKAGYESKTRAVRLAGGDDAVVHVELVPVKREVIVTSDSGVPTAAVVGWIVTGALAVSAVGVGIATNAAYSTFEEQRAAPIAGSAQQAAVDMDKHGDRADVLAFTTDILIGSAILAGGISLYFTIRGKPKPGTPAFGTFW
ncbi:MAG: PEGA domain-containing protein [Labilithrix sp.]|nr:PEGA domain-containing protein [Labilithrix sp.]